MTTLSEVTTLLRKRGYTAILDFMPSYILCKDNSQKMYPDEFIVDKHYRFEGPSDPGDEAIVFAISSPKYNLKGILINGYGASSENLSAEMIKALDEIKL